MLKRRNVTDIVLCTGHLGGKIEEFVGNGDQFGMEIRYSRDWDTLRGTGGAIKNATPLLEDEFVVINGDTYLPIDLMEMSTAFNSSEKLGMMVVFDNRTRRILAMR